MHWGGIDSPTDTALTHTTTVAVSLLITLHISLLLTYATCKASYTVMDCIRIMPPLFTPHSPPLTCYDHVPILAPCNARHHALMGYRALEHVFALPCLRNPQAEEEVEERDGRGGEGRERAMLDGVG